MADLPPLRRGPARRRRAAAAAPAARPAAHRALPTAPQAVAVRRRVVGVAAHVPEIAAVATILLLATCYVLVAHAARIFKFELQHGEVVRFNDLRALPKAQEKDEDSDSSERSASTLKSAVL